MSRKVTDDKMRRASRSRMPVEYIGPVTSFMTEDTMTTSTPIARDQEPCPECGHANAHDMENGPFSVDECRDCSCQFQAYTTARKYQPALATKDAEIEALKAEKEKWHTLAVDTDVANEKLSEQITRLRAALVQIESIDCRRDDDCRTYVQETARAALLNEGYR
jgi:hypothetical protein